MWSIFAPLVRTLRGERDSAPDYTPLEVEWFGLFLRLRLPPTVLREVVAANSLEPHFHYRRFYRKKKSGGWRELAEPDARLKQIQYEISQQYLTREQPHPAAVAYRIGKSTADHIWTHAGAEVIVIADVQDFFPSTRAERIEAWWRERVDEDTARLFTLLTTDRGGLPQGAPTSPDLSNLVNLELDTRLAARAAVAGARYTRYCDDLAFSWASGSGPPGGFDAGVRSALLEFGYSLHPTKGWQVYDRRDEPEVTGVVLTRHGDVRLPERIRKVMRQLERSGDSRDLQRLEGYLGYEEMVTRSSKRRKKKKKKEKARAAFTPPPPPPRRSRQQDRREWVPAPGSTPPSEEEIPF